MKSNLHLAFGIVVGTAFAMNIKDFTETFVNIPFTQESAAMMVSECVLGSIFPDIDAPNSYVGKLTYPVSKYVKKFGEVFGKTNEQHRGMFHDVGLCLLLMIITYFYFTPLCFFFVGCLSHIFLDMFNPNGVPFLWVKRMRLACMPANSPNANLFCLSMTGLAFLVGIIFLFI